ncbi:hypothetical protein [Aureimonas sp. AU20]|uniref:hypothetical protein n=1 Tax=Aureimonas sp. AU20 TaxID=1349819 RepID=UPI00071F9F6C|nr:hypothetical protein [Aureimonas sp. AU20]ALN74600.1 hypothetical protein M673_17930 [Aureimonas sp. AU20]
MPAHISFNDKVKALGYSVAFTAIGVKGGIRWRVAKLTGKKDGFKPSNIENMFHNRGPLSPGSIMGHMSDQEQRARETDVCTYKDYRDHLAKFAPTRTTGPVAGGHRQKAIPVASDEWDLYLAPDTAFDLTMQAIFKENDGRVLGTKTQDVDISERKGFFRKKEVVQVTAPYSASEAVVTFISSAKGVIDIKRIELNAAGQEIIAWSRSK